MESSNPEQQKQQDTSVLEFDIKVQIKDELKKGLIFGLKARPTIGITLSFVGYRDEVMPLMQTLSHATRAFIVNANGLPGFVVQFDIVKHLKEEDKAGKLENAKKWQVIDLG